MTSPDLPQTPESGAPPARRGLGLLADIFVAPARAFETIASTGEWLPATAVVVALGLAAMALLQPALRHVAFIVARTDPVTRGLDPATLTRYVDASFILMAFIQICAPLLLAVWCGLIFATVARTGLTTFTTYFALAMNCALPAAVGGLVFALVVRLHDPAGYTTWSQIVLALPDSLAVFAPHDSERALFFLSYFDVFQGWSLVMLAYGLRAIGKVRLVPALITSFTIGLAFALLQTATG